MQSEANIVDLLLSPKENSEVDCLFSELKDLNSLSVALQKEKLDMSTARLLIDETAKKFPKHDPENKYPVIEESDFVEAILQKRQKKGDESKYLNCCFLFPTSNFWRGFLVLQAML